MIKKLRRKFVIINMSLVAVILCVVLGMFCFTRVHAFRAESEIAMRQMLDSSRSKEPPKNDTKPQSPSLDFGPGGRNPAFNSTPVFLVTLDENNEITDTNSSGSYTVTDTLSEAAVSAAFAVSEDQGYLSNLKLRFIKQNTPEGTKIAFADTVQETRALGELVIQCVMMLLLFLLCFLLVSIFLARWALKPVEKAWEQQNQFIADASHELKTPVTILKGQLAGMLEGVGVYRDRDKYLLRSLQVTGRMEALVQEMLAISRMETGSVPVRREPVDLAALAERQLALDRELPEQRGQRLVADLVPGITVTGDASLLGKAVGSLLSNASLYSPERAEIRVWCGLLEGCPALTVENTGTHIRKEALPHLFEAFYRAESSRNRATGGSGLGLYLVKMILDRHGAACTIENTADGVRAAVRFSPHPIGGLPAGGVV